MSLGNHLTSDKYGLEIWHMYVFKFSSFWFDHVLLQQYRLVSEAEVVHTLEIIDDLCIDEPGKSHYGIEYGKTQVFYVLYTKSWERSYINE